MPEMTVPYLVRVKGEPPCKLHCPLAPPCAEAGSFDRSGIAGELAWVVLDMSASLGPVNTECGFCGRGFLDRNLALEQGASLMVLLADDVGDDGSWDWESCMTLAPDEVEVVEDAKVE